MSRHMPSAAPKTGLIGCVLALCAVPLIAQELKPMPASADPAYDVATIKLSDPANGSSGFQLRGRRVIVLNQTLESMMVFAYGVQRRQLVGAPAWFGTDHYDISGIPDQDGEPNFKQMQSMVRKVLASRYHLQLREEQREMPVYVLRVSKGGPHLAKTASAPDAMSDQTGNSGAVEDWQFTSNSMAELATFLQFKMDRPVLDQTGLDGKYDFHLKWTRDDVRPTDTDTGPGIFAAMPEQIGLKLEPEKGPAKVLVIVHVERPSAD